MTAPTVPRTTPVTCAVDGRLHRITDDAYAAARGGRYPAVCGHVVVAAALACPPGADCQGCAAAVAPRRLVRGRHRRRVTRRGRHRDDAR